MGLSQALHALQNTGHSKVMDPQGDHYRKLGKPDTPGNPAHAPAVLSFLSVTFSNGICLKFIFLMGLNRRNTQQPLGLKSIMLAEAAASLPAWRTRSQWRLGRIQKESDSPGNGKMLTKIKKGNQNKTDNI